MKPPTMAEALARARRGELLGYAEMRVIYGYGRTRFSDLNKRGAFNHLRATRPIGRKYFSGTLVAKDISGEPIYAPTYGRKRA